MTPMIADPQTPRPSCVYYCTLRTLAPAIQHTKMHVKALDARLGALPCQESWPPWVGLLMLGGAAHVDAEDAPQGQGLPQSTQDRGQPYGGGPRRRPTLNGSPSGVTATR